MDRNLQRGIRLGIGAYVGILLFRCYTFVCGVLFIALLPAILLRAWAPVLALGVPTLAVWLGGWWLLSGRGRARGR